MNLFFALILFAIWLFTDPVTVGDIPFSQLTINMLLKNVWVVACFCGAIYFGSKSLESERIWPWRWTKLYFVTILAKGIALFLTVVGVAYLWSEFVTASTFVQLVIGIGIFVLVINILFSDELDFEEKSIKKMLDNALAEDNPIFYENEGEGSSTASASDAPPVRLKPYAAVVGWARREAIESYVRKRFVAGDTKTPDVTELWTEDGDRFRVSFGQ